MRNFSIKRFTASLLLIVMLVAAVPATMFNFTIKASAAESETTYVLAGSDFQPTDYSTSTGVTLLNQILNPIYADGYTDFDGFLFAGDYDYGYTSSTAGKNALQSAVKSKYPNISHEIYVEGNHDCASRQGTDLVANGTLSASGENDAENYGVFVINERDFMWASNGINPTTIKATADSLKQYLDSKRNAGYTKPIFVVSHLPLHYSMRTKNDGDGSHANYIFDVLNEAGNAGLNIIFMFGHNHSNGWDDYLGGAAIYLEKGDSINIAQASKTVFKEETLAFTYMNAGYVSYYRNVNSGSETDLTMTVFEITDDEVTVKRYSANGLHNVKSKGVTNSYKNESGYSPDTTVYTSPQTITLNKTITPVNGGSGNEGGEGGEGGEGEEGGEGTATAIEKVTSLEQGVPYIIVSNRNNLVLTNKTTTNKDGADALLLEGNPDVNTEYLWYYDGEQFVYGSADSTDYLLMSSDVAYVGGASETEYRRVNAILNNDGTTFSLKRHDANNIRYLNQYGGSGYTAASPYTSDGNSDEGSKWLIYKVNLAEKELASFSANGVTVTTYGITGLNVTVETKTVDGYSAYKSYDINPENYTQGDEATVDIELDMTLFSANRPVMIIDNGTVIATVNITDGKVSFKTSHFSVYAVAQASVATSGGDWVVITKPTTAGTKYVYELDTNGIDTGVEYLIVANSYLKALSAAASSNNAVDIEIDGNYAYATSDTYGWTFTQQYSGYDNGVYYIRLNGSTYLRVSGGSLGSRNNTNSDARWTVTSNNNGSYDVVRGDYNLRWSNSNGVFQASSSSEDPVRLYKYVRTEATQTQAGLYGKIVGGLTYSVKNGDTAEEALKKVKEGITGYTFEANSMPSASIGTELDDGKLTWELDSAYGDGTTVGEYAVTIKYGNATLGVAKVVVPESNIVGYELSADTAKVPLKTSQGASTGVTLTIKYENGKSVTVPVTVDMLTNADGSPVSTAKDGTLVGLKVVYNGEVVSDQFTLEILRKEGNDYPEYPNEGAVKVNKTAVYNDEQFRKTGVAQVELSVSGVPVKKGADVIVMLDLSSSMDTNKINGISRLQILRQSLTVLLTQLQTPDDDGQPMDINIAIADFNRYYTEESSPYYINEDDHLAGGSIRTNVSGTNKVYTTNNGSSFMSVHDITANAFETTSSSNKYYLKYESGTNYDYAFDKIYDLAKEATDASAAKGEERDLYVIFMSDGAPFQYNYFSAQSGSDSSVTAARYWNNWLLGTMEDNMFDANARNDYYNPDGKHWMAEAIKGNTDMTYPVIRKNNSADTDHDNWVEVQGLGAKMYSIGFCLADDKEITVNSMDTVIRNLASSEDYYFRANSASELDHAFTRIGHDIAYAANNARFVDQMGDTFDLQLTQSVTRTVDNEQIELDVKPTITVKTYDIWTRQDYLSNKCTIDMIGVRKGTSTVLETVSFTDDGKGTVTGAYSDQLGSDNNILKDHVIYAKSFIYNNHKDGTYVDIDTNGDGNNDYRLAPETFYWKVGTVQTQELAISYYVYLTDTLQGERAPGSYATNNFAILYYDNYLGNTCELHTVSPMLAWKQANVSYAFYLVDENGAVIVDRATGTTGTFANKVAVTRPVVYQYCALNTETEIQAAMLSVSEDNVLPEGYKIFDDGAAYNIVVLSDNEDYKIGWEITKGATVATTYVTGFSKEVQYSNVVEEHRVDQGYDYTHTTVWFAVVWIPSTIKDQVVIDYGLPVDISVLENDLFKMNDASLKGVGESKPTMTTDKNYNLIPAGFLNSVDLTYGKAVLNGNKVRYTPANMQMNSYDTFVYEVEYKINNETQYYYGDVTVIPATNIYYEENFVTFEDANPNDGAYGVWVTEGTAVAGVQDEDRPGKDSLGTIDHDNVYGHDAAYTSYKEFSLGAAKKVSVNSEYGYHKDNSPTARFTFTGTGFDIISMTNSDSGVIFISVYKAGTTTAVSNKFVDNYYGYKYEKNNAWTPEPSDDAIYQVPVMKFAGLPYGTYDVVIWVTYSDYFDHDTASANGTPGYSFWLDSIRIYDPANGGKGDNDNVIEDAYGKDNESNPSYLEIGDAILPSKTNITAETKLLGVVFIDGKQDTDSAADYAGPGPNNEVYLYPGQAIAFKLSSNATPLDVQIGVKLAFGDTADVQFTYSSTNGKSESRTRTFTTATDMYYSIASYLHFVPDNQQSKTPVAWASGTITLMNVSGSVISLTNIKATFKNSGYVINGAPDTPAEISFITDTEVIENAAAVVTKFFASKPKPVLEVFDPETLAYTVVSGIRGINTVRVITSNDTDAITVNGIEAKKTDDSKIIKSMVKMLDKLYGDKHNADDYCVWTVEVKSAPVYDIVAFRIVEIPDPSIDASAVFEPETVAHTVISNINGTNTVRVITSKDVSSIIVNGVKAEKINDAKILKSMVKMLDKLYDDKHNESDYYVWTVDVKSAASYDIVAFNEYGVSTIPAIENTKNVSNK